MNYIKEYFKKNIPDLITMASAMLFLLVIFGIKSCSVNEKPVCTKEDFQYSEWSECSAAGERVKSATQKKDNVSCRVETIPDALTEKCIPAGGTTGVVNVVSLEEELVNIPSDSGKIDFILKNGLAGRDFIVVTPQKQNQQLGSSKDENNAILRSYINKYRSEFNIPDDKREGYLVIVPDHMIDKSRDMYLGIGGKTMGPILKNRSLVDFSEGKYVFKIKSVPVANIQYPLNLFSFTKYRKIQLGVSIGEKGNSVKQLMLVFTD